MYEAQNPEYIRIYEYIVMSSFFDLKYTEYMQMFQDLVIEYLSFIVTMATS